MRIFAAICLLLPLLVARADENRDDNRRIHLYLEGRSVFKENCSQCHGVLGKGDGYWAKDWIENRPRNFRTGIFKFRTTPMGKLPTDTDLRRTIRSGISGTAMPAFKSHLRESEYEAVIDYIKHLSKRWRDPENKATSIEVPSIPEWSESSKTEHLTSGKELFTKHCVSCHGTEGKGDGVAAVALVDIWGFKIKPADFSKKHHKSGPSQKDIFRTISMGLDGTPMVGFKPVLTDEQIWQLISYIYSLKLTAIP